MLLKITSTIGISDYHLCIVLCKRSGSMGCYIAMDKPCITPLIFYFISNNWRTKLFTDNSIAASDFTNGFFLRVLLSLAFWGLFAHSLGSLDAWGELYNNTYKQCNDGRALGLSHITSHMSMRHT